MLLTFNHCLRSKSIRDQFGQWFETHDHQHEITCCRDVCSVSNPLSLIGPKLFRTLFSLCGWCLAKCIIWFKCMFPFFREEFVFHSEISSTSYLNSLYFSFTTIKKYLACFTHFNTNWNTIQSHNSDSAKKSLKLAWIRGKWLNYHSFSLSSPHSLHWFFSHSQIALEHKCVFIYGNRKK